MICNVSLGVHPRQQTVGPAATVAAPSTGGGGGGGGGGVGVGGGGGTSRSSTSGGGVDVTSEAGRSSGRARVLLSRLPRGTLWVEVFRFGADLRAESGLPLLCVFPTSSARCSVEVTVQTLLPSLMLARRHIGMAALPVTSLRLLCEFLRTQDDAARLIAPLWENLPSPAHGGCGGSSAGWSHLDYRGHICFARSGIGGATAGPWRPGFAFRSLATPTEKPADGLSLVCRVGNTPRASRSRAASVSCHHDWRVACRRLYLD